GVSPRTRAGRVRPTDSSNSIAPGNSPTAYAHLIHQPHSRWQEQVADDLRTPTLAAPPRRSAGDGAAGPEGRSVMKLGLHINRFRWDGGPERLGPTLAAMAHAAEAAGFDTIAVADHVWQHPILGGTEG